MKPKTIDGLDPAVAASLHRSRGHAQALHQAKWCIEGEYVTSAQIAARTGRTPHAVSSRLRELRKQPGPITWESLKVCR